MRARRINHRTVTIGKLHDISDKGHWHPTIIPDPRDYETNLLVSGNGTYDQWNIVALDGDNEKNLHPSWKNDAQISG